MKFRFCVPIFLLLFITATALAESEPPIKEFSFSEENPFDGWKEKIFKGKVEYTIEEEPDGNRYVHAASSDASSGYYHRLSFNAKDNPMISWKWKVRKFPDKEPGDFVMKEKDDFAVRVYVVFPSGSIPASKCLEYIWDEFEEQGGVYASPYSENIQIFVLRSGKMKKDNWVYEERNVYEDYYEAFGYYPKLSVGAVAFMTDSDSVGGTSEACYDEIKVGYRE